MVGADPVAPGDRQPQEAEHHAPQPPPQEGHRPRTRARRHRPGHRHRQPVGPDPAGASFTIPQTPVVRITTPASGFDWGDAGIGAAGGLALAILGVGGGLVISHQRPRRARPTATVPD